MLTHFPPFSPKYSCEYCGIVTNNKKDYDTHLLTAKHNKLTNLTENEHFFPPKHICKKCDKIYKSRVGLWNHKKKCINNIDNIDNIHNIDNINNIDILDTNIILQLLKQNDEFKNMLIEQSKSIVEQNNKLLEVCKNGINNNTLINNNSHNKTFNLQIFLNETCKDAMNIMDFVDSLKLQLCDLERIGEVGFVTGISDIIIKNLKAMDISKRPVHCADTKREVMYVKDNDKWEKEQEGNKKLKKAIKHIAKKNSMNINLFKDKYPDCVNSHSRKSDQFNKIYIEAYGGSGNEDVDNENKIIKNIAKVVFIDKSL